MRTLWGGRPVGDSESESTSMEPRLQTHRGDAGSPLNFAADAAADAGHSE
jgi:hypothetical protein